MKAILLVLLAGLFTPPVYGQAHIVKQRAKELVEQNNARQGGTSTPAAGPARPAPSGPPQVMVASPEQLRKHDVATLQADLAGVQPGQAMAVEQSTQLTRNLTAAARGTAKPSAPTILQLSQDLGAALSQAMLTADNQAQLAQDLVSILNCANTPPNRTQAEILNVQATLQRGGVERKTAVAVAKDLKSVAQQIQNPQ